MKIKITKGHPELKGKILDLVEDSEMVWKCKKTGMKIIDTWDELFTIQDWKDDDREFWDLHLFTDSGTNLKWINAIEKL